MNDRKNFKNYTLFPPLLTTATMGINKDLHIAIVGAGECSPTPPSSHPSY